MSQYIQYRILNLLFFHPRFGLGNGNEIPLFLNMLHDCQKNGCCKTQNDGKQGGNIPGTCHIGKGFDHRVNGLEIRSAHDQRSGHRAECRDKGQDRNGKDGRLHRRQNDFKQDRTLRRTHVFCRLDRMIIESPYGTRQKHHMIRCSGKGHDKQYRSKTRKPVWI